MGKKSQSKGRAAELELCRILQGYGFDAEPGTPLNYGREPDISGLPGIHCEVKRCEQLRLQAWLDQARHDAEKFHDGLPAVFHRKNRAEWLVTMPLDSWMALYDRQKAAKHAEKEVAGNDPKKRKSLASPPGLPNESRSSEASRYW